MADERLYIVAYDIADPKRWRRVFKIMNGHGRWLQLSLFQCRLTARRKAEMAARLDREIKSGEDHLVIVDVGPAHNADLRFESLGKQTELAKRVPYII